MKHASRQLLAAGLLACTGFAALAQTPAPPAVGPLGAPPAGREHRDHFDPAKMQAHMAKRQAALKQKLQVTAAQEQAWTAFTGSMQPPAMRPARMDREAFAQLSTPERIDKMRAHQAERSAAMDKRAEATKTFYATLSADQKKVFDAETLRHEEHHGHGPRGPGGPGPRS